MRWISRLVTFAVFAAVVAGGVLLFRAKIPSQRVGQEFHTWVMFRDGSRLAVGSPVVIAGVRVGDITALSITGEFARVELRLQNGIELPADSWATRRADSLFGDSYVELIPSNGEEGASRVRLLQSGEPITHVEEGSSTDTVLRGMGRALPRVDTALDQAHDAMAAARGWVSGPFADGVESTVRFVDSGKLEAPIHRLDTAMVNVEDYTDRAARSVASAGPDVTHVFDRLDRGIAQARSKMADIRSGLHDGFAQVRDGADRIDPTIAQVGEVMSAIDDARGNDAKAKFGKLVNDPELGETLNDVAQSGADATTNLIRLRSWLGLRVEYNVFSKQPRFYVTAELRARADTFFLFELEKDPLGGLPTDDLSDVAGTTTYDRTVEISDSLRFTAEFGKQLGPFAIRAGLKDSTAGAGADFWVPGTRLQLSVDAFGGFESAPRVKLSAAYAVFRSAYLLAGIDDAFSSPGYLPIATTPGQPVPNEFASVRYGRDYFVGAILHFDDADLSTLLRVYGALIAGLI